MRQPSPFPSQSLRSASPPRTVSVARMQAIDAAAIEQYAIPRLLLMEHAGLALAQAVSALHRFGPVATRTGASRSNPPVIVCSGAGYNGGDGLCAARHLQAWGYPVHVILAGRLSQLREEPAHYAAMVQRLGVSCTELTEVRDVEQLERWLASCALIVDALLGIGIRGPVREPVAALITRMNRSGKPIVSADIPSGLDADSGLPQGVAVKATVTVAFGLAKHGCVVGEGPMHTGELIVDPITIPRALLEEP